MMHSGTAFFSLATPSGVTFVLNTSRKVSRFSPANSFNPASVTGVYDRSSDVSRFRAVNSDSLRRHGLHPER